VSGLILIESARLGIVTLTLNRPDRRNALSIALMSELVEAMDTLAADGSTRVVIVCGAGPVFCAGLDLAEAQEDSLVQRSADLVAKSLSTLKFSRLVTIAAVHGGAYAGGGGVVAACNMAIGTDSCKIGFPEARRGLLPALICDVLKSKVREGDLSELFLVGDPIDAQRAKEIGLLQRVVAEAELLAEALRMAEGVLAGGPNTIMGTKQLIHHAYQPDRLESLAKGSSISEHLKARRSDEATEGLRAFLEKRQPSWLN
jgi:methylglutaconyl-CoA hydratase